MDDLVGSVAPFAPRKSPANTHVPDEQSRNMVIAWTAAGIPYAAQSRLLMITIPTLEKHYRFELDNGAALANGMVAGTLFKKAIMGDVSSLIFWCKARMCWRDRRDYDAENPLVIKTDATPVDPHALARELRDALLEMRQVLPPPE
jgi:hypothetical protein